MKRIIFIMLLVMVLYSTLCSCSDDNDDSGDDDTTKDDVDDDTADDDTYIGDDDDTFVGDWYIDTVDDMSGEIGELLGTSIELDNNSLAHVTYFSMGGPRQLKYAYQTDSLWNIQIVPLEVYSMEFMSFDLDAEDRAHISLKEKFYYSRKAEIVNTLGYVTNFSGVWENYIIDDGNPEYLDHGGSSSIVVGSDGFVHISYQKGENGLILTSNETGEWTMIAIDGYGYCTSIVEDDNHFYHISHIAPAGVSDDDDDDDDIGEACIRYVNNVSGSWMSDCVAETNDCTRSNSLAVDGNGNPHIACHSFIEIGKFNNIYQLNYLNKISDEWVRILIDDNVSFFLSELRDSYLGLDGDGNAHIAYTGLDDEDNPVLKYATNASGEWVTEIVDPSPNSGIGASIAVDSDGYVHISYYDNGNSSLKYATNRP